MNTFCINILALCFLIANNAFSMQLATKTGRRFNLGISRYSSNNKLVLNFWNLGSQKINLPKINEAEITKIQLENPLIKKLVNNQSSAYAILKSIMLFSDHIDPLVSPNFYYGKLDKLGIYGPNIETLFELCERDLIGFMAVIRAHQLALIDDFWIRNTIESKEYINTQLIIRSVQAELYRLLDIKPLQEICGNNWDIFNRALYRRIKGHDKEPVSDDIDDVDRSIYNSYSRKNYYLE